MIRVILKSNRLLLLAKSTKCIQKQFYSMSCDFIEKKKNLVGLFEQLKGLDFNLGITNQVLLNPVLNIYDLDVEVAVKKIQARSSLYLNFAKNSIFYSPSPRNEQERENSELTSHFVTCLLNSKAPNLAFLQKQQIMNVVFLPLSSFLDTPTTTLCAEILNSEKDHLCFALVNYARSDGQEKNEMLSGKVGVGVFPCLFQINPQNGPKFFLLDNYINSSDFNETMKMEASCVFVLYFLFLYFFFFADGYLIYIYSLSFYLLYSTSTAPDLSNFQIDSSFIVYNLNILSILNIYLAGFLSCDMDTLLFYIQKAFKVINDISVLDLLFFGDGEAYNQQILQSRLDEIKKILNE